MKKIMYELNMYLFTVVKFQAKLISNTYLVILLICNTVFLLASFV